jgi:hypothetical protein
LNKIDGILDSYIYEENSVLYMILFKRNFMVEESDSANQFNNKIMVFELKDQGVVKLVKTIDSKMLPKLANFDKLAEFDYDRKNIKIIGRDKDSQYLTIVAYNDCSILSESCETDILDKDTGLRNALFQVNRDSTEKYSNIMYTSFDRDYVTNCKISSETILRIWDCTNHEFEQEEEFGGDKFFTGKLERSNEGIMLKRYDYETKTYGNFIFCEYNRNYYYSQYLDTITSVNLYSSIITVNSTNMKLWRVSKSGYAELRSNNLEEHSEFNLEIYPNLFSLGIQFRGYLMDGPYDKLFFKQQLPSIIAYKNVSIPYPIDYSLIGGNDVRVDLSKGDSNISVQESRFVDKIVYSFQDVTADKIMVAN